MFQCAAAPTSKGQMQEMREKIEVTPLCRALALKGLEEGLVN